MGSLARRRYPASCSLTKLVWAVRWHRLSMVEYRSDQSTDRPSRRHRSSYLAAVRWVSVRHSRTNSARGMSAARTP